MGNETARPLKSTGRRTFRAALNKQVQGEKTPMDLMMETYVYVRYSSYLSRTPEDLKKYGVRSSGDLDRDKALQNTPIETQLNIWAIFDLWQRGVAISVVKYSDTKIIYELVHSHLLAWRSFLANTLNEYPDELLQELIDMDMFAGAIYNHAENVFDDEDRRRIMNKGIPYSQRISMANIFKQNPGDKSNADGNAKVAGRFSSVTKTTRERVGFGGMFAEVLANQKQWRPIDSEKKEG